jgi:hypothetical protein
MPNELTDMQAANVKMAAAEKAYNAGLIDWQTYLAANEEFHRVCDQQALQGGAL